MHASYTQVLKDQALPQSTQSDKMIIGFKNKMSFHLITREKTRIDCFKFKINFSTLSNKHGINKFDYQPGRGGWAV